MNIFERIKQFFILQHLGQKQGPKIFAENFLCILSGIERMLKGKLNTYVNAFLAVDLFRAVCLIKEGKFWMVFAIKIPSQIVNW